ncbi:hypothetical protein PIB30_085100, partial [Stylosanthes scabra]|nr:hypothetical protein [Stylosanthes scabra]
IAWCFNPRGIDTPLHCGILLDTIRYTCRDLGLRNPSIKYQQENPNLVEIPPHKIPDFLHNNVANKKDLYYGALKSEIQQGESSQAADQPLPNPPNP